MKKESTFIRFGSDSLGDSIAWLGVANHFRERFDVDLTICSNWKSLFERDYPEINFVEDHDFEIKTNPTYRKGGFDDAYCVFYSKEGDPLHPEYLGNVNKLSLQNVAAGFLGFIPTDQKSVKTKLTSRIKGRPLKGKYVTISTQSTAQLKYWNFPGGWANLCMKLRKAGLTPVCVDQHEVFGNGKNMNAAPKGAVKRFGNDIGIDGVMNYIDHAEFHIGLSSGLTWLAWSQNKSVVCIQGLTNVEGGYHPNDWHMVENREVCNGCFNTDPFDKNNWMHCPKNKDFECTKTILPSMVWEEVQKLI
jgi:autotransporter strand-loop-strand O-heptosyltransferase